MERDILLPRFVKIESGCGLRLCDKLTPEQAESVLPQQGWSGWFRKKKKMAEWRGDAFPTNPPEEDWSLLHFDSNKINVWHESWWSLTGEYFVYSSRCQSVEAFNVKFQAELNIGGSFKNPRSNKDYKLIHQNTQNQQSKGVSRHSEFQSVVANTVAGRMRLSCKVRQMFVCMCSKYFNLSKSFLLWLL